MKLSDLNNIQKGIILIFIILFSINLYYTTDFNGERDNVLNDNAPRIDLLSENPSTVKVNTGKVGVFYSYTSIIDPNNLLGCTYYFVLHRTKGSKLVFKDIKKSKLKTPKLSDRNNINDYLYNTDLCTNCLVLQAPLFSKPEYVFYDNYNNEIIVKTNPVQLFTHILLLSSAPAILLIFGALLLAKGKTNIFILLIFPGSLLIFFSDFLWLSIIHAFLLYSLYRFRMTKLSEKRNAFLIIPLATIILIVIGYFYYQYNMAPYKVTNKSKDEQDAMMIAFSAVSLFIVITVYYQGYALYIFFRYPQHNITSIQVLEARLSRSGKYTSYYMDILLNDTTTITDIDINVTEFFKAQRNLPLGISKYKTTSSGNYIFY